MRLQVSALSDHHGVAHAFFTRAAPVEERGLLARDIGVSADGFVGLKQVHSPDVVTVEAPWADEARPRGDALVTRRRGIALAIATADCGPVLFYDARAGVIGAAHAGWRGALAGVLEATIASMEALGARRGDIVAALGPTISAAHYEVGPELVAAFREADPAHERFFTPNAAGRAQFDLPGFIGARLEAAGIAAFEDIARCTYAEPEHFHSYRRHTHRPEPGHGRLISAIALPG